MHQPFIECKLNSRQILDKHLGHAQVRLAHGTFASANAEAGGYDPTASESPFRPTQNVNPKTASNTDHLKGLEPGPNASTRLDFGCCSSGSAPYPQKSTERVPNRVRLLEAVSFVTWLRGTASGPSRFGTPTCLAYCTEWQSKLAHSRWLPLAEN